MRKRKWRPPNNPTGPAKQVYRAIYGEPLPKGWRVEWAGFMRNASGLCIYGERRILLNYADFKKNPRIRKSTDDLVAETRERIQRLEAQIQNVPWGLQTSGDDWIRRKIESNERYLIRLERARHKIDNANRGAVHTLIHEFTHLRHPELRHGKEFDRLVEWGWKQLTERQP